MKDSSGIGIDSRIDYSGIDSIWIESILKLHILTYIHRYIHIHIHIYRYIYIHITSGWFENSACNCTAVRTVLRTMHAQT